MTCAIRIYRKIPLIRPRRTDKGQIWWSYIQGAYIRGSGWGAYIQEKNYLNLQFFKLTFLSFFQYKARITAFFTSCKMWNMFKVNNKDTRIRKVNDKIWNKDIVDVALTSLFLTLNTFYFLLECFYCWLWSVNCRLGLLFVVLTLCVC